MTSLSSGHKQVQRSFFIMSYLTKFGDVKKAVYKLFQKLHPLVCRHQFMTSSIIPFSAVLLNLESVERKEKIYKNLSGA